MALAELLAEAGLEHLHGVMRTCDVDHLVRLQATLPSAALMAELKALGVSKLGERFKLASALRRKADEASTANHERGPLPAVELAAAATAAVVPAAAPAPPAAAAAAAAPDGDDGDEMTPEEEAEYAEWSARVDARAAEEMKQNPRYMPPLAKGTAFSLLRGSRERGDLTTSVYMLSSLVGKGAHSGVWACTLAAPFAGEHASTDTGSVALKAIAIKDFSCQPEWLEREASALRALNRLAGEGRPSPFLALLGEVDVAGHPCLAMPLCGPNLHDLQKGLKDKAESAVFRTLLDSKSGDSEMASARHAGRLPPAFAWAVCEQLVWALHALERAGIVHLDIKPQNIVFTEPTAGPPELSRRTRLTLIDLACSVTVEALEAKSHVVTYVQSRWYRAPEVLLGGHVSSPADAWSAGCIIGELALGTPLLPGESEFNMVSRMATMLGMPPEATLRSSSRVGEYFTRDGVAAESGPGTKSPPYVLRTDRQEPKVKAYATWQLRKTERRMPSLLSHADAALSQASGLGRSSRKKQASAAEEEAKRALFAELGVAAPSPAVAQPTADGMRPAEVRAVLSVIEGMLVWDPKARWGARRAAEALLAASDGDETQTI